MIQLHPVLLASVLGLSLVLGLSNSQAASHLIAYPVEGSGACNRLVNAGAKTLTAKPPTGPSVSNPDISVSYSKSDNSLTWSVISGSPTAEPPVNAIIITSNNVQGPLKSRIYHYGDVGATSGEGLSGINGDWSEIKFCYGLSADSVPPPIVEIPSCSDLAQDGGIDQSEVVCPPGETERRFIFSVDPYAPNGGIQACTCNFNQQRTVCDPAITAGEPGSCLPDPMEGGAGLDWVPAEIVIFQNGTGWCQTTASGGRICYR